MGDVGEAGLDDPSDDGNVVNVVVDLSGPSSPPSSPVSSGLWKEGMKQ